MKPMLRFLRRKMWNNRWLTFSSFLGLVLAVSFTSSIPLYSDHALSRIVSAALTDSGASVPPGSLQVRYQATRSEYTKPEAIDELDDYIVNRLPGQIRFPQQQAVTSFSIAQSLLLQDAASGQTDNRRRQMTIMSQTGLEEQAEITAGEMYDSGAEDGVIEAVVWENALSRNYLTIGGTYRYTLPTQTGNQQITVKVVGAFRPVDEQSAYWHQGVDVYSSMLLISPEVFTQTLMKEKSAYISTANWYALYDLSPMQTGDLGRIQNRLERLEPDLFQILRNTRVDISFLDLVRQIQRESLQLQAVLFMLAAPMLGMIFYYIFINAKQSLERQRNDIAVLRSRGAEMRLITAIFLLEGIFLGLAAWFSGQLIALGMARLMVSTDGFMSFVAGKESEGGWNGASGLYGLASVTAAILAGTFPVYSYGKQSIVNYKQEMARADRKPFWQRWYLDVLLALASGYGWYLFQSRQLLADSQATAGQMQVQPVFFFIPAVSIFALGLISLRLFPLLLKLLHRLLRRWIPVPLHLVLVQLSRSQRTYFPLMLLLVMTMGLGIYHASAARTIDLNASDRLMYGNGADVVLQTVWEGDVELYDEEGNYIPEDQPRNVTYAEPPSEPFRTMPGVEAASRVLTLDGDLAVAGKSLGKGRLMAVDNVEFARSAWWRQDLYKSVHPYTLLRWLGMYEQGAIVSRSFADKNSLAAGDLIQMTVQTVPMEFVIVGVTEYWPAQNPAAAFIVANIDYIYDQIPLQPYALWFKMEAGAKVMPVVEHLRKNGIETATVRDARNEWILQKLLPSREGIFGILSLGFIVSVAVSFIGYLLFWMFSLARRTVQMGIFRATGLSRGQLTFMLLAEQLLTTGLAILLGLGIGRFVSIMFVPFLQVNGQNQVPPFIIVFEMTDTIQLLIIVLAMISAGAALLTLQIQRMRVHQAVKLGEER
ncbi:FtsX-like permease family protein [Paenibacillus tarimensis]